MAAATEERGWGLGRKILIGVITLGVIIVVVGWYKLFREVPQHFRTPEEYFKYGSIGTENEEGIPYWIWLVLPRVFPEYLPGPGGYRSLGVAWEEGHETPVGFSKKTIGFPRVGINCALCHTATYRLTPTQSTQIVPTGPAQRFDAQRYLRFLWACASDPRFTADHLLPAIAYNIRLSWLDKQLYRYVLIPQTRKGLLDQQKRYAWTSTRPDWGPGRIDPFNPVKFHPRVLKLNPAEDQTIGNSDMQPIWNLAKHAGYALHWDGLNTSLTEVVLSGAIGDGATRQSLPVQKLKELETYLQTRRPPPYPFKSSLDLQLVAEGEALFKTHCASCHAFEGERTGTVIPIEEVGTDRHRLDMWTEAAAKRYNEYAAGYPWDFDQFVKTNGYVAVPLDGLWLRAPYLHNGSVPTLEALLEPSAKRPTVFYRGYDVYNRKRTGFIHRGEQARRFGFRYDTRVKGNSNVGHEGETYGTTLSRREKRALIEYLRTL